jgi:SH3 domain-containing YSC84-like protein 1
VPEPALEREEAIRRYDSLMRTFTLTLAAAVLCAPLFAAEENSKTAERLQDSADLFSEVMGTPDKQIPQTLLDKAECVVLVPGLKKAAFGVGGRYGRGFVLCRNPGGMGWGPPAAIRIEGGGIGFQIGVSSSDVILLVMNERGMKRLTTSKFTLGGEASAAAGPVGRNATAQTDALMTAEILSWSRSRGLFAGISLEGATLRNDLDENKAMYGQSWTNKQILGSGAKPPAAASKLLTILNKYSARKTS